MKLNTSKTTRYFKYQIQRIRKREKNAEMIMIIDKLLNRPKEVYKQGGIRAKMFI